MSLIPIFTRADRERGHSNTSDPLKKKLGHLSYLSYIILNNRLRKLKFVVLLYFMIYI